MLTGAAAAGCDKARRAFLGLQEQRLLRSLRQRLQELWRKDSCVESTHWTLRVGASD
ncbi:hypothetical protein C4K05_6161 [Pseudomonas chlororaphis subsp. aureofaciens]|nr:hypothetical protein C4K08_6189 [Pseudomonas chlororaphis subsp. aureofaciens]AZE39094.1 hypothetical protein C4K06_6106 [Pseudomonas chlororaphis subsp. aureofaciens]AZE45456.1 hypothetical protein C4K05_6161 [Pseudomonas chlororaphis subsp. aureofaciens]